MSTPDNADMGTPRTAATTTHTDDSYLRSDFTAGAEQPVHTAPETPATYTTYPTGASAAGGVPTPPKSYLLTALLSVLGGWFGLDRFYLGKIGTGVLKLVTFGGFGIWWLIDGILAVLGQTKDVDGRALEGYEENKKTVWIVAGVLAALMLVNGGGGFFLFPGLLFL